MDLREEDRFPAILSDLKSSFFLSSTKKSELDLCNLSASRQILQYSRHIYISQENSLLNARRNTFWHWKKRGKSEQDKLTIVLSRTSIKLRLSPFLNITPIIYVKNVS